MLMLVLFAVVAAMILCPDTPFGKTLQRWLVEMPVNRLSRMRPGHVLFMALFAAVGLVMFLLFEVEGLRLFGFMAPEVVAWFGMFDVAVFLDVFVLTVALTAGARVRTLKAQVTSALSRRLAPFVRRSDRVREIKPRTRRKSRSNAPDSEPRGMGQSFGWAT